MTTSFSSLAFHHAPGLLTADCADRLLQLAYSGLARVVANDIAHRFLGNLDLLRGNSVLLDLARNQVPLGDVHLLLFAVALQRNQFHPVQQRRRNRVKHVRRANEQYLAEIERHVEVVVTERVVLLRVKRFEQRRSRIAAEVAAQFVHFVQHDHRVVGFRPANALDDLARQCADIGPAMAANLRLVMHAAQRDPLEFAAECSRNRAAEALVLPTPGGPTKHRIGPFISGLSSQHAQIIQNPVLHLFQLVVILVENLPGFADVDFGA